MARPKLTGSDAPRARALAKRPRAPKFKLGELVIDPYDDLGAIEAIYADMQAVEDAGLVNNVDDWLRRQEKKPKTKKSGIWYAVALGEGQGVFGELDLRRAPRR